MSKTFSEKIDKFVLFSSTFFLDYFCFIAFSGVSQRWEFKNTTKAACTKTASKCFYKKIEEKIQNRFFSRFFYSRFWAFLGEGRSKTRRKESGGDLPSPQPWCFFGL
jgi:hypothetical protein